MPIRREMEFGGESKDLKETDALKHVKSTEKVSDFYVNSKYIKGKRSTAAKLSIKMV